MGEVGSYENPIPVGSEDQQQWYRMQSNYVWYRVRACCRSCATRKLHGFLDDVQRSVPSVSLDIVRDGYEGCDGPVPEETETDDKAYTARLLREPKYDRFDFIAYGGVVEGFGQYADGGTPGGFILIPRFLWRKVEKPQSLSVAFSPNEFRCIKRVVE